MDEETSVLWLDGDSIIESVFCDEFLHEHPMKCIGHSLFTTEGIISDEIQLRKMIYDNNVVEFMESTGYFRFRADSEISSRDLYQIYETWCEDNAYHPVTAKSLTAYLHQHEADYELEYTNTVHNRLGKRVWGFVGIGT